MDGRTQGIPPVIHLNNCKRKDRLDAIHFFRADVRGRCENVLLRRLNETGLVRMDIVDKFCQRFDLTHSPKHI